MRRKKLKAYWARLKELQKRDHLTRDELLLAIGAAKEKAGRNAHRLVILHLPASGEQVTAGTFRIELDRKKLKATRRHEGQYLLRSNLTGEDPAELWRNYINLVRIEESFRTLKGDLGLRPVFHQLDGRIEAHVFISFLAYCLHVTLEQYNKKAATGLSSRSVLERLSEIQMLDVTIPATDGREVRMKRYTKTRENPPSSARPTRLHPPRAAPARNSKSKACGVDLLEKRTQFQRSGPENPPNSESRVRVMILLRLDRGVAVSSIALIVQIQGIEPGNGSGLGFVNFE